MDDISNWSRVALEEEAYALGALSREEASNASRAELEETIEYHHGEMKGGTKGLHGDFDLL